MLKPLSIATLCLIAAVFAEPPPSSDAGPETIATTESPGPASLAMASFEHRLAAADLFFLDMVQTTGTRGVEHQPARFDQVEAQAHTVVDFDPHYYAAYEVGSIFLSAYGSRADASDRLVKKGTAALPEQWKFPFMLGWNDYFIRGNAKDAAEHWRKAALLPEAPVYLGSLSGRALRQATGDIPSAIRFLEDLLEHVDNPSQRDMVIERIKILQSEKVLVAYDRACAAWRAETGDFPPNPQTLFLAGSVPYPPVDLLDSQIRLDTSSGECIARSELIPVREAEAMERVGQFRASPAMGGKTTTTTTAP